MPATKDYREYLLERLRDPEESAAYLNAVLEDEDADEAVLMLALRDVVDSLGVSKVAASANLNRESLYRMLSDHGNPRLSSLIAIFQVLDLRLAVETKSASVEAIVNVTPATTHLAQKATFAVGVGGRAYSGVIGPPSIRQTEYAESENEPLSFAA